MAGTGSKLDKYIDLYKNLLPPGRLWTPREQPVFLSFITSIVTEFCRVDDRADEMKRTVDPRTASEALDLWESMLGIPDECTPDGQDLVERRSQVVQKLTNIGGLSKTFYEFIGNQLGFDITVENRRSFLAGRSVAGDPISNDFDVPFVAGTECGKQLRLIGWKYYFNVDMPATAADHFVAGSVAGTPIVVFSNELIECTIRKIKPANAGVFFTFT